MSQSQKLNRKHNLSLHNRWWQWLLILFGCAILIIAIWMIYSILDLYFGVGSNHTWTQFKVIVTTYQALLFGLGLGSVLSIVIILYAAYLFYFKTIKPEGALFGSAAWMSGKEQKQNFKWYDLNSNHQWGWILSIAKSKNHFSKQNFNLAMRVISGQHGLIIGSTGSGKTQNIILPSILFNMTATPKPTLIVADPKGTIESSLSDALALLHYKKLTFDFINFDQNQWNPLTTIQNLWAQGDTDQAELVIDSITNILTSRIKNNRDPVWHLAAQNVLAAIIFRMLIDKKQAKRVITVKMLIDRLALHVDDLRDWISDDYYDSEYLKRTANIIFENEEPKFLETVKKSAEICLKALRNKKFAEMSQGNDLSLARLQAGGVIVFLKTHLTDDTYWFLNQIFLSNLINFLIHESRLQHSAPILFCLDEFGNIPIIPSFNHVLSTAREYNLWFLIVVQSYNQLEKYSYYKDLIANCGLKYFMHTNNVDTAKRVEQEYGTQTVRSANFNAKSGGMVTGWHQISRPLINYYDLMHLPDSQYLVKVQGLNPFVVEAIPFYKLPVASAINTSMKKNHNH